MSLQKNDLMSLQNLKNDLMRYTKKNDLMWFTKNPTECDLQKNLLMHCVLFTTRGLKSFYALEQQIEEV